MTPRARAPPDAPGARGCPGVPCGYLGAALRPVLRMLSGCSRAALALLWGSLGLPWGCSATDPEDALGDLAGGCPRAALALLWGSPGTTLGLPWGCSATSPEDALGALGLLWGLLWSALPLTCWRVPVNTESKISQGKSWKTQRKLRKHVQGVKRTQSLKTRYC